MGLGMSISDKKVYLGYKVFRIEGLLNLIKSFLDGETIIRFKNVNKVIHNKIRKKVTIENNLNDFDFYFLSKINNIVSLTIRFNIDLTRLLKYIETSSLEEINIEFDYSNETVDCTYLPYLTTLNKLNIYSAKNNISYLRNIKKLTHLNIHFNYYINNDMYFDENEYLLSNIQDLSNLISLDISDMKFTNITCLKNLYKLEILEMRKCEISKGYEVLKEFKNLQKLILVSSNFNDTKYLIGLNKLVELNISECSNILDIKGIQNLVKLKILIMENMNNKKIDLDHIKNLNSLEELNLSNNIGIKNIDAISYLIELKDLKIACNCLKNINFLQNLKNLKFLDISLNETIEDFFAISNLTKLDTLFISESNLMDISFLNKLQNLKFLDISYNDTILNFEPLINLVNLERINLKDTGFCFKFCCFNWDELKHLVGVTIDKKGLSEKVKEEFEKNNIYIKFY